MAVSCIHSHSAVMTGYPLHAAAELLQAGRNGRKASQSPNALESKLAI